MFARVSSATIGALQGYVACRYFLHNWPKLCWLAFDGPHCFGTVVCKQDKHRELLRGYIAMLVVEHEYRGLGVGAQLPTLP